MGTSPSEKRLIRAFLAIELAEELKKSISDGLEPLQDHMKEFRFVEPARWHLTLHFFGEVPKKDLERLAPSLTVTVAGLKSFRLQFGRLGYFPERGRPRIFWLGLAKESPELDRLKHRIDQLLASLDFPVEKRPYHPHITLARARSDRGASGHPVSFPSVHQLPLLAVERLALFQSDLTPSGPRHRPLFLFPAANR